VGSFARRFQEAVDKDQLREFVAETLEPIDAIVEELTSRARARGHQLDSGLPPAIPDRVGRLEPTLATVPHPAL
jgi:hypothetical protein